MFHVEHFAKMKQMFHVEHSITSRHGVPRGTLCESAVMFHVEHVVGITSDTIYNLLPFNEMN